MNHALEMAVSYSTHELTKQSFGLCFWEVSGFVDVLKQIAVDGKLKDQAGVRLGLNHREELRLW